MFIDIYQQHNTAQGRKNHKMFGVGRQSQYMSKKRESSVYAAGSDAGNVAEHTPCQQKNEHDGRGVKYNQTEVNRRNCLTESGEEYRIKGINAGELHTIRGFIRRHALEHLLRHIGIFALVAFKRHCCKPPSNDCRANNNQRNRDPAPQICFGRCT
ncbi:MAG: hypothetical protein ABSH16_01590 [Sedimentisphaerales bacterium]